MKNFSFSHLARKITNWNNCTKPFHWKRSNSRESDSQTTCHLI